MQTTRAPSHSPASRPHARRVQHDHESPGSPTREIKWQPSLAVGVPAIDEDHRHLIDLVRQLHDEHVGSNDAEAVWNILQELERYTEYHFAREEDCMRRCNFEFSRSHRAEHVGMTIDVKRMVRNYRRGRVDVEHILEFMLRWFLKHIAGSDTLLAGAVQRAGLEDRA